MAWTYEATRNGYAKMWDSIKIKPSDAANATRFAKLIEAGEKEYKGVEGATGVPWYVVGAWHMREASCNFKAVLHNGQKIVGTNRKTTLVPKGRGPFKTWKAAAIDAINLKALRGLTWNPAMIGFQSERFNGLGYVGKGVNSPYLWAGSSHEQTGKYVADHVWDKDFDDPQIGVMTVLKALSNIRPDVAASLAENHTPSMSLKKKITIGGVIGGAAGTGTVAATDSQSTVDQIMPFLSFLQNYGTTVATWFTIAVVLGAVGWHFYEKYQERAEAST